MGTIRLKKLNYDIVLKILILLGFACFFYLVIRSGQVQLYVHPRIVPYLKFGMAAFIILVFFLLEDLFKPASKKFTGLSYLIFLIPLMMAFALPPQSMNTSNSQTRTLAPQAADSQTQPVNTNDSQADANSSPENNLFKLQGDTIIIKDSNFMPWMDELYGNIDKYAGKKVQITGFVFRNKDFPKNEFVAARLLMTCCVADLQLVGLLCHYAQASTLPEDGWFKVSGVISKTDFQGEVMPGIDVQEVEKAEKPKEEYVYPY